MEEDPEDMYVDRSILDLEPVIWTGPVARLTPRNLKALLHTLGLQPGIHLARYLYSEYVIMCREVEAMPISQKAFGMSLAYQGCTPCTKRADGKQQRAWMIPRSRFAGILPGEEAQEFSPDSRHPTIQHPEGT